MIEKLTALNRPVVATAACEPPARGFGISSRALLTALRTKGWDGAGGTAEG